MCYVYCTVYDWDLVQLSLVKLFARGIEPNFPPTGETCSPIIEQHLCFGQEELMTMDQKKLRLQTSMRMLKDEPVPEGYMRYR